MIDLYGMASPNVIKVAIMLEELGEPWRLIYINLWRQQNFDAEFLKISPTNKVPAIVDHDGPGGEPISVFESGAILLYLGEKTGRFLPADPRHRTSVYEWLMVQMSLMGPMAGQAVHFVNYVPPGGDYTYPIERYYSQCANVHRLLDKRLSERPFLAGEACTVADFATYPWLDFGMSFFPWLLDREPDLDARGRRGRYPFPENDGSKLRELFPHLARWYEDMRSRPAVQDASRIVDEARVASQSSIAAATPDLLDRFLLRGAYSAVPLDPGGKV